MANCFGHANGLIQERHNSIANALELFFFLSLIRHRRVFYEMLVSNDSPNKELQSELKKQRTRGYLGYCQRYLFYIKMYFLNCDNACENNNSKTRDDSFIELFGINVKMVNELFLIRNYHRPTGKKKFCRWEKYHRVSLRWKQIAFQQHSHYVESNIYITNIMYELQQIAYFINMV